MTSSTATTVEIAPAGTWVLDTVHSSISFEVAYLGGTFRGRFTDVAAKLDTSGEPSLTGSARVESIQVQDENLATHLLSPDFFDAERHPELSFASSSLNREGNELTLEGELTIKGVTKPVTLNGTIGEPVIDYAERERVSIDLETTVDRTEFGVSWNAPLPSGEPALSNDVRLISQLYFTKES